MSRSNIAEEEEWLQKECAVSTVVRCHTGKRCGTYTEVGDDGIDDGDFEPTLCVRRC